MSAADNLAAEQQVCQHDLSGNEGRHLRVRLVVEQAIQQTVSGSFIAFGSRFIHARRRTGDGFRDHPDVGVRRGNWIAVRAVTDLPAPLVAK